MTLSRRGFFSGLTALVAAPAIVRVENIMQVVPTEIILPESASILTIATQKTVDVSYSSNLLTIREIMMEAIKNFKNSNAFIQALDREFAQEFATSGAKIGQQLRIRLPKDFLVADGSTLSSE